MSYEIGTATSASDLLSKLKVVAIANGWAVNNDTNPTVGTRWLSLGVAGHVFNLLSDSSIGAEPNVGPYIYGCQSTGYDSGSAWNAQPNSSYLTSGSSGNHGVCRCNELAGPFPSYRIFGSSTYLHMVVETVPGVFSHIAIGILNKYGSYTGGGYMSMSNWYRQQGSTNYPESQHSYLFDWSNGDSNNLCSPTILRAEVDSQRYFYKVPTGAALLRMTGVIRGQQGNTDIPNIEKQNYVMFKRTPNAFNLVTPLLPTPLSVPRGSGLYSAVGDVPDIRVVNMTRFNSGDELTIGPDQWVLIAAKSKTLSFDTYAAVAPSSGNYGYAYKKVT